MTRPRRLGTGAATVALLVTTAACSSDGPPATTATPTPPSTPVSVPASTPTPTPTTSAATPTPTTSAAPSPSTTAPSSTPVASPSPAAPAFTTTCTKLTVRVIPGGAVRGEEIAAVQYTNDGTAACTITGVPRARLLLGGRPVGSPSQPTSATPKPFTLQPGDVGESLLRDFSTCEAPLADRIRVSLPSRGGVDGGTTTAPVKLRACAIRLAPVGPPA